MTELYSAILNPSGPNFEEWNQVLGSHRVPLESPETQSVLLLSLYNLQFLEYVRNTNGGATTQNFIEDWEPIGQRVWNDLVREKLIGTNAEGRIVLTAKGAEIVAANGRIPTP